MGSLKVDYVLPTNADESQRLDYQHKLLTRTFGLHRAPLRQDKLRRVLDVGCGTGNWSIEFAQKYPDAEVIGFDISEDPGWQAAPPNCHFRVLDLEADETWASLSDLDYIHGRFLTPSVRDWPKLLRRCFASLRPGGFVEFQNFYLPVKCEDDIPAGASKYLVWSGYMMDAMEKCGLNPTVMVSFPELLTTAGFADVKMDDYRMMFGPWGDGEEEKALGLMGQQNQARGMYGFGAFLFVKILGWSEGEYGRFVDEIVDEIWSNKFRNFLPMRVGVARRPE